MSPILHGMLAWLVAVMISKNVNDRRLIVIAGVIPDIDGIFILFDQAAYNTYHHTFGHSLVFGIMVALVASFLSSDKTKVAIAALGAFSLHLFSDIIGSNWAIQPFCPISEWAVGNPAFLTNVIIYDIINPGTFFIAFFIIAAIAFFKGFTPFEFLSEKLDNKLVEILIKPFKKHIFKN